MTFLRNGPTELDLHVDIFTDTRPMLNIIQIATNFMFYRAQVVTTREPLTAPFVKITYRDQSKSSGFQSLDELRDFILNALIIPETERFLSNTGLGS